MTTTLFKPQRRINTPPAPGSEEWATLITASKVPPMITDNNGEYAGLGA